MTRVLDIDLDFFLEGAAHWRSATDDRLDPAEFPPWRSDDVVAFLEQRCCLTGRLPGFVVENHSDLFSRWRDAIAGGKLELPLEVSHVDAHADLGLGDGGYMYLMTELLFEPVDRRLFPKMGHAGLNDSNWLAFAVACRWISSLTYVFNLEEGPPNDIMPWVMEGFTSRADNIELAAMEEDELWKIDSPTPPTVDQFEPKVPFRWSPWSRFRAAERYDVVCLTRSPAFTPPELDPMFDLIRASYIDETFFGLG
jgi:hypothetical protein